MSHVTASEIAQAVAAVYQVSLAEMRNRTGMGIEARCAVLLLVERHTLATTQEALEAMGYEAKSTNASDARRMAQAYHGRLASDPWRCILMERVEKRIDAIHEARAGRADNHAAVFTAKLRPKVLRDMPRIREGEPSISWWAANDAVFRAAFRDAAE